MTTSNLNSAVIMGFFAAAIGAVVLCVAALQDSEATATQVSNESFASVSAEDILRP